MPRRRGAAGDARTPPLVIAADFTDAAGHPAVLHTVRHASRRQAKIPKHKPHPLLLPRVCADLGLPSRAQRAREAPVWPC
jgi:hypothetical protein